MKEKLLNLRQLPVATQLTLILGIVLSIWLGIILVAVQSLYTHVLKSQMEKRALSVAENVASIALAPLLHSDEVSLHQNLMRVTRQENVSFLTILDSRGKVFAWSTAYPTDTLQTMFHLNSQVLQNIAHTSHYIEYFPRHSLIQVYKPIFANGVHWGTVVLGFDYQSAARAAEQVRWLSALAGVLLILLCIWGVQKISEGVLAPVQELVKGTEEVSRGNFDFQIPVTREDELGYLARKFNEMTVKLKQYRQQQEVLAGKLQDYSEQLEEKVKLATRQLRQIQEEVLQIFHQIPVGLLVVHADGEIRWFNDELVHILKVRQRERLKKSNIFQQKPFRDKQFLEKLREIVRQKQQTVFRSEYKPAGESERLLEVRTQPLQEENGQVVGMIFILRDITHETELERTLNRTQRLESMGKLAGGIAHDFNNILAIILPTSQMLKMRLTPDSELWPLVETIEKATHKAASLTSQILSFARGSKGGKTEVFNLNRLIQEFQTMIARVVDKRIEIRTQLDPELWNINADRTQIEQILMNLSMNAVDAMPDGGTLFYRTENVEIEEKDSVYYPNLKQGHFVKLEVIDTGVGMPKEILDRIFDPFFTAKKKEKGTGLGLSMVYGIVKGYQGFIDVQSEPGRGSKFTIYLPATTQKTFATNGREQKVTPSGGTILLVDDEEMLRNSLHAMLTSLKYEVHLATNGQEAVELYQKLRSRIDLILMDIQMPVMDGLEAAKKIWQINPEVPIVFSSGYADPEKFEELRRRGVKNFLKKPYQIKDLVDIIERALQKVE